jgi:hypothetical protein
MVEPTLRKAGRLGRLWPARGTTLSPRAQLGRAAHCQDPQPAHGLTAAELIAMARAARGGAPISRK